jgi:hypothetical protein
LQHPLEILAIFQNLNCNIIRYLLPYDHVIDKAVLIPNCIKDKNEEKALRLQTMLKERWKLNYTICHFFS